MSSCKKENEPKLEVGDWWATMQVTEKEFLPFNFSISLEMLMK